MLKTYAILPRKVFPIVTYQPYNDFRPRDPFNIFAYDKQLKKNMGYGNAELKTLLSKTNIRQKYEIDHVVRWMRKWCQETKQKNLQRETDESIPSRTQIRRIRFLCERNDSNEFFVLRDKEDHEPLPDYARVQSDLIFICRCIEKLVKAKKNSREELMLLPTLPDLQALVQEIAQTKIF
jgi:hypothetical protein